MTEISGAAWDVAPLEPAGREEPVRRTPRMGRISLRTLTLIRWLAVTGQVAALLTVHFALGYDLPLTAALGVVATSAVLSTIDFWWPRSPGRLPERDAAFYLGYDMLQLSTLLFLTGGLQNPFSVLLLAPVTVAATALSRRSVITLSVLTCVSFTLLAFCHLPLPWHGREPLDVPDLYVLGSWIALTVSTGFISLYTVSVAEEARLLTDAYAATQLALSREQQVSAVGALAAAAAHELGSPLGTIAVIARELARDLPADSPFAEDAALLQSQSERCRRILAELAHRPDPDGGTPFTRLPLPALVEAAGSRYHDRAPQVRVRYGSVCGDREQQAAPEVARSPEIVHGLGNLLQNAISFARRDVRVTTFWDDAVATIAIEDDGPGFPAALLSRLGEPYLSGRPEGTEHMGLGIFIARTLLERTGATVSFENGAAGGASVTVSWVRRGPAQADIFAVGQGT